MKYEKAVEHINNLSEEYLTFLEDICNIESNSYDKEEINKVVSYIREYEKDNEYYFEVKSFEKAGSVMSVEYIADKSKPFITISGHMDTVYKKGEFGYPPVKKDKKYIYGPGVSDCKGGIAVGFLVMKALKDCDFDGCNIRMILQSDEEVSSSLSDMKTVDYICEKSKNSIAFLNLETRMKGRITVERKGIITALYKVMGKRIHAKDKQFGANAINAAAMKIAEIAVADKEGIAYNCGIVNGGIATNVVPDECIFEVEVRIKNMENYNDVIGFLKSVAEKEHIKGTKIEFKITSKRLPYERKERNMNLLEKVNSISLKYGFGELKERTSTGGSDASYPSEMGIPTLDGFGIIGEKYHTVEERAEIKSLTESAKLLAAIIIELSEEAGK